MPTKTTEKAGAKKTTAKKADAKPNALQKPLQPSKELAAVVGAGPLSRGEVVSKVWDYIKKNNLQNPQNKRQTAAGVRQEESNDVRDEQALGSAPQVEARPCRARGQPGPRGAGAPCAPMCGMVDPGGVRLRRLGRSRELNCINSSE